MDKDKQLVELIGRNWLTNELFLAGLEVARPQRDRGIDLIVYSDLDIEFGKFIAVPIQMKAASEAAFGLDRKYERFPDLLIAYVWYLKDPHRTTTYAMTYREAVSLLEWKGYAQTPSWIDTNRYVTTRPAIDLMERFEQFKMSPEKWRNMIRSRASVTAQ